MKAALLTKHGEPLRLANIEPEPLQYGQVLVKLIASGICGAQIQEIDGHKQGGPLPHPLGHEGFGIVQEVGIGVRQVKPGDKAILHWRKGDGIESDFPRYSYEGKIITGGKCNTFMEYAVCSENRLTAVPHDTPVELAALLGCGLSTALGVIENEANLRIGESVLIIGCGGLGLNLILAAKMRQAAFIAASDIVKQKEVTAVSMGAKIIVQLGNGSALKFDIVIDTTGSPDAISHGLNHLAPSGRLIMVGQPKPGTSVPIDNARHLFDGEGCSIKATQGGCFQPSRDIARYIRSYEAGHLKIEGIVTHRYALPFINEAIQLVRDGQAGRVLLTMNP